jgi:transcription factor 1
MRSSLLGVDNLLAHFRCPLKYSRNFSANEVVRKRGRAAKLKVPPPTPPPPPPNPFESGGPFAASLKHYSSLPPLPPLGDWLSHFPYAPIVVRDRISIRDPLSAIHVAHSFVDAKKTSTGNPKTVIEAFPGASVLSSRGHVFLTVVLGPGALSRAFLTLPPSKLKKLIILEDYEPYLEYLRVCFTVFGPFSAFNCHVPS